MGAGQSAPAGRQWLKRQLTRQTLQELVTLHGPLQSACPQQATHRYTAVHNAAGVADTAPQAVVCDGLDYQDDLGPFARVAIRKCLHWLACRRLCAFVSLDAAMQAAGTKDVYCRTVTYTAICSAQRCTGKTSCIILSLAILYEATSSEPCIPTHDTRVFASWYSCAAMHCMACLSGTV